MKLMVLLVVALATAALFDQSATLQALQPSAQSVAISAAATQFLAYRSAVMAFTTANPTFTGTIQPSQLSVYAPQYSSTFITMYSVSNAVTTSGTGVLVTVYAALPGGSVQSVLVQSNNDASIGLSAGTTWTTDANGVVTSPQPLNVTVPVGDVVSVFKTGN
ncbi:hypothetical protein P3T23_009280 [Paraburkholderia sp. GAS448]|uniref:type IV pilus biogenesis protein PilM n=1 Tax=Paraburkholderia sp. GAS448 TaxID=3035136 RepID=UPI003D219219